MLPYCTVWMFERATSDHSSQFLIQRVQFYILILISSFIASLQTIYSYLDIEHLKMNVPISHVITFVVSPAIKSRVTHSNFWDLLYDQKLRFNTVENFPVVDVNEIVKLGEYQSAFCSFTFRIFTKIDTLLKLLNLSIL